jgi:hypothetical protein
MKPIMLSLISLVFFAACATGPRPYLDASHKPTREQQRDRVECQALAAQAAQGAGIWSSDPAIRAAIRANAQDSQLIQCLESRGWTWKTGY